METNYFSHQKQLHNWSHAFHLRNKDWRKKSTLRLLSSSIHSLFAFVQLRLTVHWFFRLHRTVSSSVLMSCLHSSWFWREGFNVHCHAHPTESDQLLSSSRSLALNSLSGEKTCVELSDDSCDEDHCIGNTFNGDSRHHRRSSRLAFQR